MTEPIAPPGPERDAQVAVEAMGASSNQWERRYPDPPYSSDDRECVAVLLEMQRQRWSYGTGFNNGNPPFQWAMFERDGQGYRADADTLAAAVTEAALRAVRAQGGEHDRA